MMSPISFNGIHAITSIGTFTIGVFLMASDTKVAYNNTLNILPNHNNQIAFKLNNLEKNIPIAGAK